MNSNNDGGPAFPGTIRKTEKYIDEGWYGHTRHTNVPHDGMSLRDWFAGMVLMGTYASGDLALSMDRIAGDCYGVADAMIAERGKM